MGYRKQVESKEDGLKTNDKKGAKSTASATPAGPADATIQRVMRQVAAENYAKALDLLNSAGREPQIRNAKGVCLLRLGRHEEAIRVFRELVLTAGCTWMRSDLPTIYKTNFATALLLGGHPAGCVETLNEINDEQHPAVQRLRTAVRQWEKSLSLWQKLNWKIARMEPGNRPVNLDFVPGDFDVEVMRPDAPPTGPTTPSLRTAV